MEFGQRVDVVVIEEFVFVEYVFEDFFKFVFVNDGEEDLIIFVFLVDVCYVFFCKIVLVFDELVYMFFEVRKFVDEFWFKSCCSVEWNQVDQ